MSLPSEKCNSTHKSRKPHQHPPYHNYANKPKIRLETIDPSVDVNKVAKGKDADIRKVLTTKALFFQKLDDRVSYQPKQLANIFPWDVHFPLPGRDLSALREKGKAKPKPVNEPKSASRKLHPLPYESVQRASPDKSGFRSLTHVNLTTNSSAGSHSRSQRKVSPLWGAKKNSR